MPRKRKNELIQCEHFAWTLWKRNDLYQADGRSNTIDAGRHSLGTRDRAEALEALRQLDLDAAVSAGLVDEGVLEEREDRLLGLNEGRKIYEEKVAAPRVAGGGSPATRKRYRAVFDKFIPFARSRNVVSWNGVKERLLTAYATWLEKERGCAERSIYLELTTVMQAIGFLVKHDHLPRSCKFTMSLDKPVDSPTYCYRPEEVAAIVRYCMARQDLAWAGQVFTALACTGLRIGELSQLRWSDIDRDNDLVHVTNDPSARPGEGEPRRTKNRRDRVIPIHDELFEVLEALPRGRGERVFHGPRGGALKGDTVRNVLTRDVLPAVATELRQRGIETEVERGRLHSFRHYFCSVCANRNVPEQTVMDWLGHQDSGMLRYYYHLADEHAQAEMKRLTFLDGPPPAGEAADEDRPDRDREAG